MDNKKEQVLSILEKDCTTSVEQIAAMLSMEVVEVACIIDECRKNGTILKDRSVINWEKTNREIVTAMIELKVTPQRGGGFDRIAERIYQYTEVNSLYLMSGGFDLMVIIQGKSMKEVALFVSEKLAPLESVLGTATHFVLKKYKHDDVIFEDTIEDDREVITL